MSLPTPLHSALAEALRAHGDPGPILHIDYVGGGDINQAARITTAANRYFVKWHESPPPDFFACEAHALTLLAGTKTVRVPEVIGEGVVPHSRTAFLILEWIERGGPGQRAAEDLGRALAALHHIQQPSYGLDRDNYIGRTPQPNAPSASWLEFYRTQRLGAQRSLAERNGRLSPGRAKMLDHLIEHLDQWIDDRACQPSLLHGDLWGGNWMVGAQGEPVLIDPAVYCGDREADLAMTTLFGGFPAGFYAAYREAFPLLPGHAEREPLYQLYHLLNHLYLFGEGYGSSVDRVLRHFVS